MGEEYETATVLFDVTYKCNDNCAFCFNQKNINKNRELSLHEIKDNFYYVKNKYDVKSIIITGGEPTCHSDFWGMMDFLYNQTGTNMQPSLNTNALIFEDENEAEKLRKFLSESTSSNKIISISVSSIKHTKKLTAYEKQKLRGVENAIIAGLDSGTQVLTVVMIDKTNYKTAPFIAEFLSDIITKFNKKNGTYKSISIQLRLPYIGRYYMTEEQMKKCVPSKFSTIKPNIVSFIKKIQKNQGISLRFFNIPFCLFKDSIPVESLLNKIEYMSEELRIKVSPERQMESITSNLYFKESTKTEDCSDCFWKHKCNKIQKEYLDRKIVPNLRPHLAKETRELKQLLIDKAVKFNEGLAVTGKKHHWLIDCKEVMMTSKGAKLVSKLLYEKLKTFKSNFICGAPISGIPLVSFLIIEAQKNKRDIKGLITKRQTTEHGLQKQIEGRLETGKSVVLVDDLVDSGTTMYRMIEAVKKQNATVEGAIMLVNFLHAGNKRLRQDGYKVEYLFSLEDLFINNKSEKGRLVAPKHIWTLHGYNMWQTSVPRSNPVLYRDSILIGTNEGKFLSIDIKTGKINWTHKVSEFNIPIAKVKGILSSPVVYKDNVFFGAYDGYLYCLDANTGKLRWRKKRGDWIGSSPYISGNIVYVGIEYGRSFGVLIACSAEDGKLLWHLKTDHYIHSSPVVDIKTNTVVIGCNDGFVYATNSKTGRLKWKFEVGRETRGWFAVDNGLVYFGSETGKMYCLDIKTSNIIWEKRFGFRIFNRPLVTGDRLVFSTVSNRIFCVDKTNGSIIWYYNTLYYIFSNPEIIDGLVYCGCEDGFLYVLELETGKLIKKYFMEKEILTKPLIHKKMVVLGCKGKIICSSLADFKKITENINMPKTKAILFDITYKCNDNCEFCHNQHLQLKGKKDQNQGQMSLKEIKDNAYYLVNNFDLSSIAISGGEPTIYPYFWEMMDFFYNDVGRNLYLSLDTNALRFADKTEAVKLHDFFKNSKCRRRGVEISVCSINDFKNLSDYEKRKLQGAINVTNAALHSKSFVRFYMYITKQNHKILPDLLDLFFREISKYQNPLVSIETGLISFDIERKYTMDSVPDNFEQIEPYVKSIMGKIISQPNLEVHLMNLPLCLLKDHDYFPKLLNRIQFLPDSQELLRINVWNQKENLVRAKGWTRRSNWQSSYALMQYCSECNLKNKCNKLKERFLEAGIIKELYPFKQGDKN